MAQSLPPQLGEAISVLLRSEVDQATRNNADAWLREFQSSPAAWQAGLVMVQDTTLPENVRHMGITMITNKLRGGGGGGLAPDHAAALRQALLTSLRDMTAAGPLRSKSCQAVSLLLGGIPHEPAALVLTEAVKLS